MLTAFTVHKFHKSPIQLSTVRDCLIQSGVPLPSTLEDLACLFKKLDSCGYLQFLKNEEELQESWITLDPMALYRITNSVLCTLKEQRECKAGIVPLSSLEKHFRGKFDPQFVCKYLSNMELCHLINDEQDLVHLTPSEQYYFIPALLDIHPPLKQIWQSGENYKQCTGWCLTSIPNPWSFLPVHLLHTLLLRFALPLMQSQTGDVAPQLLQGCFVWKNGIRWLNLKNGIETVIELTRQSTTVTVVMRCRKGNEMEQICHRSEVIAKVLEAKNKVSPTESTREFLLHPDEVKYPLDSMSSLRRFDVHKIADAVVNSEHYILADGQSHSEHVDKVLYFEPFLGLRSDVLEALFDGTNQESPTPAFLYKLAEDFYNRWKDQELLETKASWEILATIMGSSTELISELQDAQDKDSFSKHKSVVKEFEERHEIIKQLCHRLHQYSIFCGRNLLKLATGYSSSLYKRSEPVEGGSTPGSHTEQQMETTDLQLAPSDITDGRNVTDGAMRKDDVGIILTLADLAALTNILYGISSHWKDIGLQLGIPLGDLNNIGSNLVLIVEGPTGYLRETLQEWLRRTGPPGPPATLKALSEVLRCPVVGEESLANELKHKYLQYKSGQPESPQKIWKVADDTTLDETYLIDVKTELKHMSIRKWFNLGLVLRLHYDTLDKIRINKRDQVDDCMTEMLVAWLKKRDDVTKYGMPSWQTLVRALLEPVVGEVGLARSIALAYRKKEFAVCVELTLFAAYVKYSSLAH